jgi:hypothetical protein
MAIFAYLDAGTGSLVVQAVIGVIVGVGVVVRAFWSRITGIFKRSDSGSEEKKPPAKSSKTSE